VPDSASSAGVEQEVRRLSSLRSCYRCCGFERVAKNRSLASLPCLMEVDSCECQPVKEGSSRPPAK
jgi:hypothetical protein